MPDNYGYDYGGLDDLDAPASPPPAVTGEAMTEELRMINQLDAVVDALGIAESADEPADVIRALIAHNTQLEAEVARLRASGTAVSENMVSAALQAVLTSVPNGAVIIGADGTVGLLYIQGGSFVPSAPNAEARALGALLQRKV